MKRRASAFVPEHEMHGFFFCSECTALKYCMATLARKLRVTDYFTLGWGTMVGVGWLVVMDDWLLRGGSLGGILGFTIGGMLLLPIGYVYGQLVMAMPDAAGEVAYTAKVFPQSVSFARKFSALVHPHSVRFGASGYADCPLLHDGL